MIFISWVIVIIVAIVIIQLPILPFRGMFKEIYQDLLNLWNWLLKIWNSFPFSARFIIAIISFMALAFTIMLLYKFHSWFDTLFLSADVKNLINEGELGQEELSNIRRNIWLLGFAIFGGCIAIWARSAHERQLKYTQKQLDNSAEINRNDRFIKAVEMLGHINDKALSMEGLRTLLSLATESPKTEYFRCVNKICNWLLERPKNDKSLLHIATEIFKIKISAKDVEEILEANGVIEVNYFTSRRFWPNLRGVNLQGADLQGANLGSASLVRADLRGADLQGANLGSAYLVSADLRDAELEKANLESAYLVSADLRGARLSWVRLQKAKLREAKLQKTDLGFANLQEADLQEANLQNAVVAHANLEKANLKNTILKGADLMSVKMRGAENLEKKQILSAYWATEHHIWTRPKRELFLPKMYLRGKSPELPDYLLDDHKVQDWLSNPTVDLFEETVTKKIITKKATAKKIKAKSKKATAKKIKAKSKKATAKKPKN